MIMIMNLLKIELKFINNSLFNDILLLIILLSIYIYNI